MCTTCGCTDEHPTTPTKGTVIELQRDILSKNDHLAHHNQAHLRSKGIFCLNLMSSPGSGKTALLEKTIHLLKGSIPLYVIEGDQQTSNDADRIAALEVPVIQINTGSGCHLDAHMVHEAIHTLNPAEHAVLFIENVGNLVCPALFKLGESKRVVIISTTEGEDKPLKYPQMFATADICIINKIDLLPYINFNLPLLEANLKQINPEMQIFKVSATSGKGMSAWCAYLKQTASEQAVSQTPCAPHQHPAKHHHHMSHNSQRMFFDEHAATWDETNHPNIERVKRFIAKLHIQPTDHVLDVGCATGFMETHLIPLVPEGLVVGVDFSKEMLHIAAHKHEDAQNLHFYQLDIETASFQEQFDKIILFSIFPHLEHPMHTIEQLLRVNLKPGGLLLIAHDRGRAFLNQLHQQIDGRVEKALLLPVEEQVRLFRKAGIAPDSYAETHETYWILFRKPAC